MLYADGTKHCPRCGETKLAKGNFYRSGASGDGYGGYCIQCTKAAATAWQKALPEDRRFAKNKADWQRRKRDPEARKRAAAWQKAWADRNREHVREWHRAWSLAYKHRDPERRRQQNQIHNNHQRAKRLGVESNFQYADWLVVLEAFAHRCAYCGADGALLDMDHLDPLGPGANVVGNVVPACRLCNANKGRKTLVTYASERGFNADAVRVKAALVREGK